MELKSEKMRREHLTNEIPSHISRKEGDTPGEAVLQHKSSRMLVFRLQDLFLLYNCLKEFFHRNSEPSSSESLMHIAAEPPLKGHWVPDPRYVNHQSSGECQPDMQGHFCLIGVTHCALRVCLYSLSNDG